MNNHKMFVPDAIGEFEKLSAVVMGASSSVSSASSESSVSEEEPEVAEPGADPKPALKLGEARRYAA